MLKDLSLGYAIGLIFFFFSTTVSAVPMEQSWTKKNKRQLVGGSSSSLSESIKDAINLDKNIKETQDDEDSDSDSDDGDGDDDDDKNDGHQSHRPSATPTTSLAVSASASATNVADTLPSATGKFALQTPASSGSSKGRDLAIAGGVIGGLIFLALLGFALHRWKASKKKNQGSWNDEKSDLMYQARQETPPSTLFGGHGNSSVRSAPRLHEPIPAMPKPPPLVLVLRGSEKRLEDDDQAFLYDQEPNTNNLPPVYEEMRSPSQESSISQTIPYPSRNAATRKKLYASFQPPPIPESPEAEPNMQSRFSWTTRSVRTSVESAPRFRNVVSWVGHQANRPSMKEKLAKLGMDEEPSVPPTPAEFRHHPGAPVSFLAQHGRQESADLDRQFMQGR